MQKKALNNMHWIFLVAASLVATLLTALATWKYGAGVAGDSIHYLSVADNLVQGHGFFDSAGSPLILFPPLFPMVIAGLAWVFQADVFKVGWVLNVLLAGLNLFLSGYFLRRIFQTRPLYFYASCLVILFSSSEMAMHASVLSDPIFLTVSLLFFIVGDNYIQKPGWQSYLSLLLLALLAPLLRFSGFAQIVAGGLIILYAHGRQILKSFPLRVCLAFFHYFQPPCGSIYITSGSMEPGGGPIMPAVPISSSTCCNLFAR